MERWTLGPARFRGLAIFTVALLCVLVVAGAVVRLTGSGLGCDDWPSCNDTRFIDVSSGHAAIEQVNRIFSGLIAVPVLAMAIGSFRVRPRRPGLVGPSLGVLVTVLANGVVGGLAVRGDLHPVLVQSHFVLAMISIAFGLVAAWRAGDRGTGSSARSTAMAPSDDRALGEPVRRYATAVTVVAVGTALALATGTVVTGTGPHAGDEEARRFGFDIGAVARLHSVVVLATVAVAVLAAWLATRTGPYRDRFVSSMSTWLFVAVVQGALGYVQYFNGVPEVLAGLHVAGATALWVVTVWLTLGARGPGGVDARRPKTQRIAAGATASA
jgi:cytochrome c oxidase assembly protein subunit 15